MKRVKGIALFCVCAVLTLGAAQVYAAEKTEEKIESGIRIGGVDVSGMDYEQAQEAVKPVVSEKLGAKVELKIGEHKISLPLKIMENPMILKSTPQKNPLRKI